MVKSVDKEFATNGDTLTFTTVINNIGNILVSNVVFTDVLPDGATFVPGSVTVNSTSKPTFDPEDGINLGSMLILATTTVTFEAIVESVPSPNTIINKSETEFSYLVLVPITGESESNEVTTTINVTDLVLTKSAEVNAAKSGDTITYTIEIENNGNIPATNIEFIDAIDSSTTFVSESVIVNSTSEPTFDPEVGFTLPDIAPTDITTVTFEVTVN